VPTHETQNDRDNEQAIMSMIYPNARKLSNFYRFDFFVDEPPCVYEVKSRKKKYPTWFVSLSKVMVGMNYESVGLAAFFLVRFEDTGEIFRVRPATTDFTYEWGGNSRGDANDIEPLAVFKLDDMEPITAPH